MSVSNPTPLDLAATIDSNVQRDAHWNDDQSIWFGRQSAETNWEGGRAYWDSASTKFRIAVEAGGSGTNRDLGISVGGNEVLTVRADESRVDITQAVIDAAAPTAFTITAGAHTNCTTLSEVSDVVIDLNRTITWAAGNFDFQRSMRIEAPTYAAGAATTINRSYTFSISGPPAAGANMTLTSPLAFAVQSGGSVLGGPWNIFRTFSTYNITAAVADGLHVMPIDASGGVEDGYLNVSYGVSLKASWLVSNVLTFHNSTNISLSQIQTDLGTLYATNGSNSVDFAISSMAWSVGAGGGFEISNGASARTLRGRFWMEPTHSRILFGTVTALPLEIQTNSVQRAYLPGGGGFIIGTGTALAGSEIFLVSSGGSQFNDWVFINKAIGTGAVPEILELEEGAHTALTASTERHSVRFNLANTITWATGGITNQRAFYIEAPTYAFAGASTITTAATVAISGAPIAGANATLTASYALRVESGITSLEGGLLVNAGGADVDSRLAGDTLTHMLYLEGNAASENIALLAASLPAWNSMDRGIFIGDGTAPSGDPTSGGYFFSDAGALKWRGSSGTITTIAPA
jgi:hypothetical protein